MKILVTGGAGFIGSALVRELILNTEHSVVNLDKLTYASNLDSVEQVSSSERYQFAQIDICDREAVSALLESAKPDAIMHLAAESHVDRSIDSPQEFLTTNVLGTAQLLEAARAYWSTLAPSAQSAFRFHHISTDEVYGDLSADAPAFSESHPYAPSSPYSASKASSDHCVRAWHRTYGLPILVTNCSNNYGPFHFPEKLIPHVTLNALHGRPLPVYGDGLQVRDWLYVEDHARALIAVLERGRVGETYNVGGNNEVTNLQVVETICGLLDGLITRKPSGVSSFSDLIEFVTDRPGHDRRYAIDASKIQKELGWRPQETFESGIKKTVQWFLDHEIWWQSVLSGDYRLKRIGHSGAGS